MQLASGGYSTKVDVLERDSGESQFGPFHYRPIRFVRIGRVDRNEKLLLAFDGLVIGQVQGVRPLHGRVIYGPTFRTSRVLLDAYYDDLSTALTQLADCSTDTREEPPLLIPHCDVCEFREHCRDEATQLDHLSLLKGMTEKEIRRHNSKGIFTVNQLSYTFRARKPRKRTKHPSRPHNFALQALAIRRKRRNRRGGVDSR